MHATPSAASPSPTEDTVARPDLLAAQVQAVYRQALIVYAATALVALVTVFVIDGAVDRLMLIAWACIVIVLAGVRTIDYLRYPGRAIDPQEAPLWARRFTLGATISGLLWGFAAAAFYVPSSPLHQAFVILVIGGLVAGAAVTYSVLPRAFNGFAIPALLGLGGRIALELWWGSGERTFVVAQGVLVGWYMFALHRLSLQAFHRFARTHRDREEIRHLADDLLKQRGALQRSNLELSAEIEKRRQLAVELHESRQRLSTALTNIPAIVWVTDLDGRFTLLEGKGLSSLGDMAPRLMGHSVYAAFRDPHPFPDAVRAAIAGRQSSFTAEYGGHIFQTFSGPLRDAEGSIAGALGVALDVSEREQMKQLRRFRAALEASAEGIFLIDRSTLSFIDFNETARRMLGYKRDELLSLGPLDTMVGVSEKELESDYDELFDRVSRASVRDPGMRLFRRRDGSVFSGEVVRRALWSGGSRIIVAAVRDVSERVANQERLRLAYSVLDGMSEGVMITDPKGVLVWVNPSFERLTGYSPAEAIGRTPALLKSHRHDSEFYRSIYAALARAGSWSGEVWNRNRSGTVTPQRVSITTMRDDAGNIVNYVAIFNDISLQKESEARIQFLATHDALTGLPNRTLFWEELHGALLRAKRDQHSVAVFFLDLDEFKSINDTLGHLVGDEVLKAVSQRLRDALRQTDLIARLGGDEFAVAIGQITEQREVEPVAQKVLRAIGRPIKVADGHEISVTPSIGVSLFPRDGKDVETLIKHSDVALYRAKAHGRNCYRFFSAEMTRRHLDNLRIETALRKALDAQELRVSYQPRVDARSGALIGMEALARWTHEQLGSVPPQRFIRIAEDTGLIYALGDWVLRTACAQARAWHDAGIPVPRIAVNISPKQFREPSFAERVTTVLRESGLPAERLEIEVTETNVMADLDLASRVLGALARLGVHLSLDDFGTGHSSLAYLQRFPLHSIKIDRGVVADIETDDGRAQLTQAVITLGHSLGLRVVAEGVETRGQLRFLQERECDEMQGYLVAAPMTPDECSGWLSAAAESGRVLH